MAEASTPSVFGVGYTGEQAASSVEALVSPVAVHRTYSVGRIESELDGNTREGGRKGNRSPTDLPPQRDANPFKNLRGGT